MPPKLEAGLDSFSYLGNRHPTGSARCARSTPGTNNLCRRAMQTCSLSLPPKNDLTVFNAYFKISPFRIQIND